MTAGPWTGLRVLELSGLSGAYATRLWAALGADVVVAEPVNGHPLRHLPPFIDETPSQRTSVWWTFLAQGKQSVIAPPDSDALASLWSGADVVITDRPPDEALPEARHERQVVVAVSPFGTSGPRRRWRGSDHIAWASSGISNAVGFPGRPPLSPAPIVQLASHVTSLYAVSAAMLGVLAARNSGRGQVVDLSMQECCLSFAPEIGVALYLDDAIPRSRPGNRRNITRPWGLYPCADGHVSILILQPAHWHALARWIAQSTGSDGILDEVFADMRVRWEVSEFIDDYTEQLTRPRRKTDLFHEGQARGIPITPVNTLADLCDDPHLERSGYWRTQQQGADEELTVPGSPFRTTPSWFRWSPAPTLGGDTGWNDDGQLWPTVERRR